MSKIKAIGLETTAAPVSADEAEQLKTRIQESLVEIRQAKKWDEFMEMEDRADIEILEAKLKSSLTVINQFLKTGEWSAPAGAGTGETTSSTTATTYDLEEGWNGPVTIRKELPADRQGLPTDAVFEGTVYIEDNNNPEQDLQVGFKLSDTATDFRAYNRGRDIVYVETYKDEQGNSKKRYWIGKNHVTNVRANIGVSAYDLDHGVNIDLSRTYRISDGSNGITAGTPGQFVITGSDGYDTIYGSQGKDYIVGLKGNDKLYGMGGEDVVYGDDDSAWGNARAQGAFGLRSDLKDGDDIIDGGANWDQMFGGGGLDYGYTSDATSGTNPEIKSGIEEGNIQSSNDAPSVSSVINWDETRGWDDRTTGPGTIEISETDTSGNATLSLKMPQGYDMAFGEEMPGGDLKITYVGTNDGGPPKTFTVIVRGALSSREGSLNAPFIFKFKGNSGANIIDFHNVNFKNNAVEIDGVQNNDMILAPKNSLSEEGLSMNTLLNPDYRTPARQTRANLNDLIPNRDGIDANVNGDNEVEVSLTGSPPREGVPLQIDPTDYDKAYTLIDGNDLLVVLVKNTGGEPETTIVRIKDYKDFIGQAMNDRMSGSLSWLILSSKEETTNDGDETENPEDPVTLDAIPLIAGTTIRGGEGDDFVFASETDSVPDENDSHVVRVRYSPGERATHTPGSGETSGTGETGGSEEPADTGDDDDAGLPPEA